VPCTGADSDYFGDARVITAVCSVALRLETKDIREDLVSLLRRTRAAEPERPVPSLLEVYGARLLPDLSGWWVYALGAGTDGHVFYVGISESLKRRLDAHEHTYPHLWDPRRVYLIPADNELSACIRQLALIDFYQPECNTLGATEALRRRVAALDKPAGRVSRSLDQSKAVV
jgi:hypothetical protein